MPLLMCMATKLTAGEQHIQDMKADGIDIELIDEFNSMEGNVYWTKNSVAKHFVLLEQYGERYFKECRSTQHAKDFMEEVIYSLCDDGVVQLFIE